MSYKLNAITGRFDVVERVVGSTISGNMVFQETPTPATDGAQVVFTVANAYVSGTLMVYLDGLRQIPTTDYSETTSTTFTMVAAPDSDEVLRVDYIKS